MRSVSELRRAVTIAAGTVILSAALAAPAVADDWPTRPPTVVIGFGVGGSADRTARGVATFLPEELGQPVMLVNRPGAGSQLAAAFVLAQPADGYTILGTAISPYLATSILVGNAQYAIDDFAFINAQWTDWDILAVHRDSPYQSVPELLEAIRDNPRRLSVSLVFGSSGHLTTLLLLEAAGIPRENLNLVNYDSGAAARSALAGDQVTFTLLGAEGSEGVREFIRPLAVVRDEPSEDWDAPTINEALAPMSIEVPVLLGSMRGLAVSRAFKEQHPERFDKLVDAYRRTLEKPEVQRYLSRSGVGGDWLGPERTTEAVMRMYRAFERYRDVLTQ
jgi:putative tricarboxylic transport membrane protein